MKDYLHKLVLAFDQFWNVALDPLLRPMTGVSGDEDETVSSRLGKAITLKNKDCRLCHWICTLINYVDPRYYKHEEFDHCKNAIEADEGDPISGEGP